MNCAKNSFLSIGYQATIASLMKEFPYTTWGYIDQTGISQISQNIIQVGDWLTTYQTVLENPMLFLAAGVGTTMAAMKSLLEHHNLDWKDVYFDNISEEIGTGIPQGQYSNRIIFGTATWFAKRTVPEKSVILTPVR